MVKTWNLTSISHLFNFPYTHCKRQQSRRAYKVLADVVEVFAIFLQSLFKQHGLWGAPLLHFVAAENWTPLRNQGGHGFGQVIVVLLQCVHGMELTAETNRRTLECHHHRHQIPSLSSDSNIRVHHLKSATYTCKHSHIANLLRNKRPKKGRTG